LYIRYTDKLFLLNQISYDSLERGISAAIPFEGWRIQKKVPGILRSVCDFFLAHGSLELLLNNLNGSEELVKLVSTEVFYMGRSSIMKFKARTFALLIVKGFEEIQRRFWNSGSLLPITSGANRLMYFIGPLKFQKGEKLSGENKLQYFNRFYNFLFPNASWKVFSAFDMHKKGTDSELYECQKVISGCLNCPIAKFCLSQ
jgi:hypothetical protein